MTTCKISAFNSRLMEEMEIEHRRTELLNALCRDLIEVLGLPDTTTALTIRWKAREKPKIEVEFDGFLPEEVELKEFNKAREAQR